jgi:CheY-like chemotaxis protein
MAFITPSRQAKSYQMMPSKGKQHLHPTQFPIPRGRALLLDDDEKDLKYFTSLLEGLACSVRAFTNYQEAEGCLEHEPFDFIVVSPAFEAHRLMELTLARCQHTSVVLLTGCLEMNCCFAAMRLGAVDCLEKSLSRTQFVHLVTTHCEPRQGEISRPCIGEVERTVGRKPRPPRDPSPKRGEICGSARVNEASAGAGRALGGNA